MIPAWLVVGMLLTVSVSAQSAAPDVAAGRTTFQALCASCHGAAGKGDGVAAAGLNPKPRNFQDTAFGASRTDAALKKVILEGGAASGLSPVMPSWKGSLTDQDVVNLIAYIRSLSGAVAK